MVSSPSYFEVGEGLIDGAPRLSPGQPIDQQVLRYVSDAGVGHLVPDADNALVVGGGGLPGYQLELAAHLVP